MEDPLTAVVAAEAEAGLKLAWRQLKELSEAEFWWEPVQGCWTVQPAGKEVSGVLPARGDWAIDGLFTNPEPAPLTTIGWRLNHMTIVMAGYYDLLGQSSPSVDVEGSAERAVASWRRMSDIFMDAVKGLSEESAREMVEVEHWGRPVPRWTIVGHVVREQVHHSAEIGCLRHLLRVQAIALE